MNVERLKKLSETVGISGAEADVAAFLEQELLKLNFACRKDAFGNLLAHRPGQGKHVLLEAHIDQVGMMVSEITDDGFVRFSPIGGLDLRILPSQEVVIYGKEPTFGVVCFHPSENPEEKSTAPTLDRLCIDTGLGKETAKAVSVGDRVSFTGSAFVQNGFFFGRALDNRASAETLLSFLETTDLSCEYSVLFAVQEEVGLVGATVATQVSDVDLAVVFDVTFGQTHGGKEEGTFICGKGPAIGIGPSVSYKDAKEMIRVAEERQIPHQIEVMGGSSGTDAWAIQLMGDGIPTVMLSVPLRYMHTPIEQFAISDIENTLLLLNAYLKEVCG